MNLTGTNFPARARESDAAGLTREPSVAVMPFRVAEWPSRRWRSTAASTTVDGDLGLSPGTSVTGFAPGQVDGTVHAADAVALQAKNDLVAAYDDAAGRPTTATVPVEFGGTTKTPGVYGVPGGHLRDHPYTVAARGSGSGPCAATTCPRPPLPDPHLVEITGAGHYPHETAPARLLPPVHTFLRTTAPFHYDETRWRHLLSQPHPDQ